MTRTQLDRQHSRILLHQQPGAYGATTTIITTLTKSIRTITTPNRVVKMKSLHRRVSVLRVTKQMTSMLMFCPLFHKRLRLSKPNVHCDNAIFVGLLGLGNLNDIAEFVCQSDIETSANARQSTYERYIHSGTIQTVAAAAAAAAAIAATTMWRRFRIL